MATITNKELATTVPALTTETMEIRRVVVALDLGEAGQVALRAATNTMRGWPRGELHVLHIEPADAGPVSAKKLEQNARSIDVDRDKLRRFVLSNAHDLPSLGRISTILHLRYGDAETLARDLCADVDADLLVLGVEEPKGVASLFHPTLAAALVKSSHCPVLIAKPKKYTSSDTEGHQRLSVEAPCVDCLAERLASNNTRFWCARHAEAHTSAHTFAYTETLPFESHDNETMGPTGV